MAGLAMLVLLAQDVLGLDARGYGLLLACLAVGGMLGGTVAARLHRRLGDQGSVVGSTLLMGAAWALLAATDLPVVAGAGVALYGLAAVWWNVVTVAFRQAVVPERLQGRVNSAYRLVSWGTLSVGAAAGGLVAAQLGLRAHPQKWVRLDRSPGHRCYTSEVPGRHAGRARRRSSEVEQAAHNRCVGGSSPPAATR